MRGIKTFTANVFFFAVAPALLAASPDYFPLQVGHQWVFRSEGRIQQVQVAEVTGRSTFDGRDYFALRFFGAEAWVRMDDDGTLYAWNAEENRENVWIPFGAEEGTAFDTAIPCNREGRIARKDSEFAGPAGQFGNALTVAFLTSCADAGLDSIVFVPNAGPVQVTVGNIAGPVRYELIYSRTGATVLSAPETSFGLTIDAPVYQFEPPGTAGTPPRFALARISLRNTHSQPVEITFSSGQTYELLLRNERGDIVWRWSDGRAFTLALRTVQFGPGEKNWVELVPIAGLPAGRYTLEAFLVTLEPQRYAASVSFEIRDSR